MNDFLKYAKTSDIVLAYRVYFGVWAVAMAGATTLILFSRVPELALASGPLGALALYAAVVR